MDSSDELREFLCFIQEDEMLRQFLVDRSQGFVVPVVRSPGENCIILWLYVSTENAEAHKILEICKQVIKIGSTSHVMDKYRGIEIVACLGKIDADNAPRRVVRLSVWTGFEESALNLSAQQFKEVSPADGVTTRWYHLPDVI